MSVNLGKSSGNVGLGELADSVTEMSVNLGNSSEM